MDWKHMQKHTHTDTLNDIFMSQPVLFVSCELGGTDFYVKLYL